MKKLIAILIIGLFLSSSIVFAAPAGSGGSGSSPTPKPTAPYVVYVQSGSPSVHLITATAEVILLGPMLSGATVKSYSKGYVVTSATTNSNGIANLYGNCNKVIVSKHGYASLDFNPLAAPSIGAIVTLKKLKPIYY